MEAYPSRYDLVPGTAERVMKEARWFVLWFGPRWDVFVAISERKDIGVWDGYILELQWDETYDVSECSLGGTFLHTGFDSKACDITSDPKQVAAFFDQIRKRRQMA